MRVQEVSTGWPCDNSSTKWHDIFVLAVLRWTNYHTTFSILSYFDCDNLSFIKILPPIYICICKTAGYSSSQISRGSIVRWIFWPPTGALIVTVERAQEIVLSFSDRQPAWGHVGPLQHQRSGQPLAIWHLVSTFGKARRCNPRVGVICIDRCSTCNYVLYILYEQLSSTPGLLLPPEARLCQEPVYGCWWRSIPFRWWPGCSTAFYG